MMIMVTVMMVMMISSDGATRGRVCDQLQGRHHRCAQVSFFCHDQYAQGWFSEIGILLLILFNYSYSRYVPGENSGARKSSRKKGTLMILIKVIIIAIMMIIFTLPDHFHYVRSLSLLCLMITCIISDHTYHLIKIS